MKLILKLVMPNGTLLNTELNSLFPVSPEPQKLLASSGKKNIGQVN